MEIIAFGVDDIENKLATMRPDELDQLPFGVIQVDGTGKILQYNTAEGRMVNRDPREAIGRNFFTEVAPCTNKMGFRDRFDQGVRSGNMNVVFEWQFVGDRMPLVQVHMKKATTPDKYWLFVKRL